MAHHLPDHIPGSTRLELSVLKNLTPRFRPHLGSLILCAVLLAVFSLLSLAGPLLVRHAIDVVFPNKDFTGLLEVAGIYLGILFLSFAVNYFQQVRLETVGQEIIKNIRTDVFTRLTRLEQSYFDKNPVGKLLSRVESDTEAIRTMFTYTVVAILSDLVTMVGMFAVMFVLSARLTLVLLAVAPVVIFTVRYFNRRIVPIFIEVRRKTADIYAFLEEYLRGAPIVQAFDQEQTVIDHMDRVNKSKVDVEYPGERLSNYFGHLVFLLSTLATVLVLAAGGGWAIRSPEAVSIGTLVAFLGYIQRFFGPIFHLSEQMNVIQKAFAGAKRINDILNHPTQEAYTISPAEPEDTGAAAATAAPHETAGIEFRNVWFAYKPGEWVLQDMSFTVPRGARTAIVGPTGSGKTTLISLLFRFYHPQKGVILLDGRDIRTMSIHELRERLGLVLQDITLFPGTILDNLRLEDPTISRDRVESALATVNARGLVDRTPGGLDGIIAEHGGNMSVGERQLLSFARAMVFDPEILVLDEATSSVDPLTEHRVQTAVNRLLTGRTALIIAHRLQTIVDSDDIIVLQNGRIREQGNHRALLEHGGLYWQLYQIQHGAGKVAS